MAEPQDAKPETTVAKGAGAPGGPEGDAAGAEGGRESYHAQADGTDEGDQSLGRKDPENTGQNARDDGGVATR